MPESFSILYKQIKDINLKFNVYPLKVVIENAMVSNSFFPLWINKYKNLTAKEKEFLNIYSNQAEKYVLQSYIVSGKNEFLKNINNNNYPSKFIPYITEFENLKIDKNSGWVTSYWNFYQEVVLKENWSLQEQLNKFQVYFPEIHAIIKTIERLKK